ncbi:hypothetical protein CDD82_6886 [Ophiocordyceps australis]|uniref:Uncharacterized protein n=1 Tax=Ophiocordyceps australis TaxID=1399860 RepID=A0A2C5YVI2_9HYPO|nr:hypothetical protein CDD82_6886 [Ophiocordyceps australis]
MPATPRLIPGTGASTMTAEDYFRAQWSALSMVQTFLSLFAVFVILRSCLRRACSLWTRLEGLSCLTADGKVRSRLKGPRMVTSREASPSDRAPGATSGAFSHDETADDEQVGNTGADLSPQLIISRRPPAPPLTAPELSSAVFTIDTTPHQQDSFMHQPNPDYLSSTADLFPQADVALSPPRARRRSYARTLSLGGSAPQESTAAAPDTTADPTSVPNANPLTNLSRRNSRGDFSTRPSRRDVDVRGEIISVLNDEGAGWTRHTRVYGRGVCLACAASGGGGEGFYGTTVTPEEMHQ